MITLTIANQKGGVGKSTTAATIATELALRGYRTLIVDADPQANATSVFLDPANVTTSLADAIIEKNNTFSPLHEVIITTQIEGLDLLPATLSLARFEREPALTAAGRLRRALKGEVKEIYDFCIIDTPPNLGLLLSAALLAADHVIIPVQAAVWALAAVNDLLPVIDSAKEYNEQINILGAVCTMVDQRTNISGQTFLQLKGLLKDKTFDTVIHRTAKIEDAAVKHQPIQLFAPNSRAAENYAELTAEMLDRLGLAHQRDKSLRLVGSAQNA